MEHIPLLYYINIFNFNCIIDIIMATNKSMVISTIVIYIAEFNATSGNVGVVVVVDIVVNVMIEMRSWVV